MESLDFKSLPEDQLSQFAETHPVREWPVGFVRELSHRNYRPISHRPDLIEASKEWLEPTLEAASSRFGKIAEDLGQIALKFPKIPPIPLQTLSSVESIPEALEIDRIEISSPELANTLVDHETKQLLRSFVYSSSVSSRWTKVGAIAAIAAAVVGIAGLILQALLP